MSTRKPGENAAAAGLRESAAMAAAAFKNAPAPTTSELVREIVLRSIVGPDAGMLVGSMTNGRRVSAKSISKSMSAPLDDVRLVLKAFDGFLQSTADELARKAAGA